MWRWRRRWRWRWRWWSRCCCCCSCLVLLLLLLRRLRSGCCCSGFQAAVVAVVVVAVMFIAVILRRSQSLSVRPEAETGPEFLGKPPARPCSERRGHFAQHSARARLEALFGTRFSGIVLNAPFSGRGRNQEANHPLLLFTCEQKVSPLGLVEHCDVLQSLGAAK